MSLIFPFKAGYYNTQKTFHVDDCLSSPFDEIDSSEVAHLQKNPYHYSHVIRTDPADKESYVVAKHKLFGWFIRDVIVFDKVPAVYVYDQPFWHQEATIRRLSLMALVSLDEVVKRLSFYQTTAEDYLDNSYQRLATSQCSLEPVLIGYHSSSLKVADIAYRALSQPPFLSFGEPGEKENRLYQIGEPSLITHVENSLQNEKLYLLDGHHRLRAAIRYKEEQKTAKGSSYTGTEPWNFIFVSVVNMADNGFSTLAWNRLVQNLPEPAQDIIKKIGTKFKLAAIPFQDALTEKAARKKMRALLSDYQSKNIVAFGISVSQAVNKYFLAVGGSGFSPAVLDSEVIQNTMGLQPRYPHIHYESQDHRALDKIKNKIYQMGLFPQTLSMPAFLQLNPNQTFAPRSFDFYPKVPSGVLLYSFKYSC